MRLILILGNIYREIEMRLILILGNIYREIEIRMLIKEHWQYYQSRLKLNHSSTNLLTFNFWLVYIQAFSNAIKFLIVWFYLNSGKLPNQIKEKMSIMILVQKKKKKRIPKDQQFGINRRMYKKFIEKLREKEREPFFEFRQTTRLN